MHVPIVLKLTIPVFEIISSRYENIRQTCFYKQVRIMNEWSYEWKKYQNRYLKKFLAYMRTFSRKKKESSISFLASLPILTLGKLISTQLDIIRDNTKTSRQRRGFFSINLTNIHCTNYCRHFVKIKKWTKTLQTKTITYANKVSRWHIKQYIKEKVKSKGMITNWNINYRKTYQLWENLFSSQHKNKDMQKRDTRRDVTINYFDRWYEISF